MDAFEILLLSAAALAGVAGSIWGAIAVSERMSRKKEPRG